MGIGGAKNHGLKNGSTFKVQTLHLRLPVIVQFLYGIIAVTEGGDLVCLDILTQRTTPGSMTELK